MERLLDKVESRTEEVLKKHCEEWLSCEVTTLEKAFPYLPSTLMALLAAKVKNHKTAGQVLSFLDENNFDGRWAQKPEVLLTKWMNEDTEVIPVLEKSYEYIMGEYKDMVLEQLESTGDLEIWQLKRLLPFLSAILLSSLAEWETEEQADQGDLLSFIKEHYEEIKRTTPSKLMEILKKDSVLEERAEKDKKEEKDKEKDVKLSYKKLIPYIIGILTLIVLIYWINSGKVTDADEIPVTDTLANEVDKDINYRLWQLKGPHSLQLENDDPLNKLVERLVGIQTDSVNEFYLRSIAWQDTVLPEYYSNTIEHIKILHQAFPETNFHINIKILKYRKQDKSFSSGEIIKNIIQSKMPGLLETNTVTYSIDVSETDDWSPDLAKDIILHAEMQWVIIPKN